jgi:FdhD protein
MFASAFKRVLGSHADTCAASEPFAGQRWEQGRIEHTLDAIASETALALVYNGKPHVVMMVTPQDIEDFVLGFSLSEGIVQKARELFDVRVRHLSDGLQADIRIDASRFAELQRKQRNLTGRTGCGLCGAQTLAQAVRHPPAVAQTVHMAPQALQRAMVALAKEQPIFADTGAVHAAAWVDEDGSIRVVREDVGRHNALDKLIGSMIRAGGAIGRGAALITSRASHEMVQKAAVVGIEIVCAVSAPTSMAIRLARQTQVTLVAFARSERQTVYAHPARLGLQQERLA